MGLPIRSRPEIRRWLDNGRPSPPPHAIKARNLMVMTDLFGLDTLVETGTFKGMMIDATVKRFRKIYSIEIFEPLARRARERFAGDSRVTITHGDSATALPQLLPSIREPVLFWLDGHFSGEGTGLGEEKSPVVAEITAILNLRKGFADVKVIDDARRFNGTGGYPILGDFVATLQRQFHCDIRTTDDAIFVMPGTARDAG